MQFESSLSQAKLLKRYKRFLADVIDHEGKQLTVFCPNTGSMMGCSQPDSILWFSNSSNQERKYPHTWELLQLENNHLICINTWHANTLVAEAINNGVIGELQGYEKIRAEVKYGKNSRIDFLLTKVDEHCYVEVKSVTLGRENIGYFPDAVTERGTKHLRELMIVKQAGHRAVLIFCVQHTGVTSVSPAADIDPIYSTTLQEAVNAGVEVYAYQAAISPLSMQLTQSLPIILEIPT